MIRAATSDDFPACLEMARTFWSRTGYDDPFDDDHVMEMIELAAESELLFVYEVERQPAEFSSAEGFIAGLLLPLLGNGDVFQVTELAYWVNPSHRGTAGYKLLAALELQAKVLGAKYINMIALESSFPEVAAGIYERRLYRKLETTYCKELAA